MPLFAKLAPTRWGWEARFDIGVPGADECGLVTGEGACGGIPTAEVWCSWGKC